MLRSLCVFSRPVLFCLLAVGVSASGCASVKLGSHGGADEVSSKVISERTALADAAGKLKNKPWPTPTQTSVSDKMISVLFGKSDQEEVSKEDACEAYIRSIDTGTQNKWLRVVTDADQMLSHGRSVAEAGHQTAQSLTPIKHDVVMMEDAISDLQESRDMYVLTLKLLRERGEDVPSQQIGEMKQAFSQTISDIGHAADIVADRASQADRLQYAQPAPLAHQ